ncbi:hypothetical protein GPALN_006552 [Globodera pallida]|nr:hypothetical protein GPALN_006552 [Globodera pallida]
MLVSVAAQSGSNSQLMSTLCTVHFSMSGDVKGMGRETVVCVCHFVQSAPSPICTVPLLHSPRFAQSSLCTPPLYTVLPLHSPPSAQFPLCTLPPLHKPPLYTVPPLHSPPSAHPPSAQSPFRTLSLYIYSKPFLISINARHTGTRTRAVTMCHVLYIPRPTTLFALDMLNTGHTSTLCTVLIGDVKGMGRETVVCVCHFAQFAPPPSAPSPLAQSSLCTVPPLHRPRFAQSSLCTVLPLHRPPLYYLRTF